LWKCYELEFKVKTPIHIGYGSKLGIINRTRYYIPGKTMWGAVTATLAREAMEGYEPKLYEDVGEFVREHMIFSYFYPLKDESVLYPNYTDNGFGFGENNEYFISKEEFERDFVTSYISTAVDKSSKTAEESSLHEFELILPDNLLGYLFVDLDKNEDYDVSFAEIGEKKITLRINNNPIKVFDSIESIQIGGERNYGFGQLELQKKKIREKNNPVNLYDSEVSVDLNNLTSETTNIALAHVDIKNLNFENFRGDIEPIVGREWDKSSNKGAGQCISDPKICLSPGSKFSSKYGVKIGCYGIWEADL
jgi:hypothetical protein